VRQRAHRAASGAHGTVEVAGSAVLELDLVSFKAFVFLGGPNSPQDGCKL
jgi:hypothetical protein